MYKDVKELLNNLSIHYKDISLYESALTHPSHNAEVFLHDDYERLEFIGDAVLGFVSAELFYKLHPEMDQGLMSKGRSYLVKSKSLANYARKINLHLYIRTGHSIPQNQIYSSDKILEDVFEALIGAIYLDLGIVKATNYIKSFLYNDIKNINVDDLTDYKTKLQEAMQAEYRNSVEYRLIEEKGPPHDRTFTVRVTFNGLTLGVGTGKSKKQAEELAAKDALSKGTY